MNTPRSQTALTGRTSAPAKESGQLGSCDTLRVDEHYVTFDLSALSWRRFQCVQIEMPSTNCETAVDNEEVAADGHEP